MTFWNRKWSDLGKRTSTKLDSGNSLFLSFSWRWLFLSSSCPIIGKSLWVSSEKSVQILIELNGKALLFTNALLEEYILFLPCLVRLFSKVLMPRRSSLTHESIVKNRTRNALLLLPLSQWNSFCTSKGYARFRLSLPCPISCLQDKARQIEISN